MKSHKNSMLKYAKEKIIESAKATTFVQKDKPYKEKFSMPDLCNSCTHKQCCTGFASPLVFEKDYENLKKIHKSQYTEIKKINGKDVRTIKKKIRDKSYSENGTSNWSHTSVEPCVFWDKETSCCTIYENRPFDCRLFPFDIYKIDEKYTWVIYNCNDKNYNKSSKDKITKKISDNWQWCETSIQEFEQDTQLNDILKNIDVYSDRTEINAIEEEEKMPFVVLREVMHNQIHTERISK